LHFLSWKWHYIHQLPKQKISLCYHLQPFPKSVFLPETLFPVFPAHHLWQAVLVFLLGHIHNTLPSAFHLPCAHLSMC
jgi:hypothetical protein